MEYFDNFNENGQIRDDANKYEIFHNDLNELISDFINSTSNLNLNKLILELSENVYNVFKKGTLIKNINNKECIYGIKIKTINNKNNHIKIKKEGK